MVKKLKKKQVSIITYFVKKKKKYIYTNTLRYKSKTV